MFLLPLAHSPQGTCSCALRARLRGRHADGPRAGAGWDVGGDEGRCHRAASGRATESIFAAASTGRELCQHRLVHHACQRYVRPSRARCCVSCAAVFAPLRCCGTAVPAGHAGGGNGRAAVGSWAHERAEAPLPRRQCEWPGGSRAARGVPQRAGAAAGRHGAGAARGGRGGFCAPRRCSRQRHVRRVPRRPVAERKRRGGVHRVRRRESDHRGVRRHIGGGLRGVGCRSGSAGRRARAGVGRRRRCGAGIGGNVRRPKPARRRDVTHVHAGFALPRPRPPDRRRYISHAGAARGRQRVRVWLERNGQLGLGDTTDRNAPTRCRRSPASVSSSPVRTRWRCTRTAACPRLVGTTMGSRPWRYDRPQRADQGAVARRRPSARRRYAHAGAARGRQRVRVWWNTYGQLGLATRPTATRRPRCRRSPASVSSSPVHITRWRCTRTAACPRLVGTTMGSSALATRPTATRRPRCVARRRPSARRRCMSHAGAARGRQRVRVWSRAEQIWAARPWRRPTATRRPRCRRSPASVSSSPVVSHAGAARGRQRVRVWSEQRMGSSALATRPTATRRPRCRRSPASVSSSPVNITRWRCTRTAACPRLV